jgi:hypothetical protein
MPGRTGLDGLTGLQQDATGDGPRAVPAGIAGIARMAVLARVAGAGARRRRAGVVLARAAGDEAAGAGEAAVDAGAAGDEAGGGGAEPAPYIQVPVSWTTPGSRTTSRTVT